MPRMGFVITYHEGQDEEYARRHQPIWAELEAVLLGHGIRTYSIFMNRPTRQLFAYLECDDAALLAKVAQTDVCRRWWAHMAPLMPSAPDNTPLWEPLAEVFHIQAGSGPERILTK